MDALAAQEVMEQINNRFVRDEEWGTFTISGGSITSRILTDGQWFWIEGSTFNDGLHQFNVSRETEETALVGSALVGKARVGNDSATVTDDALTDETFEGRILGLAIPKTFESLVDEMEEWTLKHAGDGYTSESFGGYSYSLPTNAKTGMAATVYDVFGSRLNKWRRLPCL